MAFRKRGVDAHISGDPQRYRLLEGEVFMIFTLRYALNGKKYLQPRLICEHLAPEVISKRAVKIDDCSQFPQERGAQLTVLPLIGT